MNFIEISMEHHWVSLIFKWVHDILQGVPLAKCHEHREKSMQIDDFPVELPNGIHWTSWNFHELPYILQGVPLAKCKEINWKSMEFNELYWKFSRTSLKFIVFQWCSWHFAACSTLRSNLEHTLVNGPTWSTLWVPAGAQWVPFGMLWVPFCALWVPRMCISMGI